MRFLCILLLVGLVATPQPDTIRDEASQLAVAHGKSTAVSVDVDGPEVSGSSPLGVGDAPFAVRLRGTSTWYCSATSRCTRGYSPSDLVAAIDTSTGFHKGDQLRVRSGGKSVRVTIVDVCLCRGERVIDLTSGAFRRLAPLSRGVIPVSLELVGGIDVPLTRPAPTGPPTDIAP